MLFLSPFVVDTYEARLGILLPGKASPLETTVHKLKNLILRISTTRYSCEHKSSLKRKCANWMLYEPSQIQLGLLMTKK